MRKPSGVLQGCGAILSAIAFMGALCNNTTPTGAQGVAPVISPISGGIVFVSEPIDYKLYASDADGDAVTWTAVKPQSALLNSATGVFSWRPAVSDTGSQIIAFIASDGKNRDTVNVQYTVVLPTLAADQPGKILRPVAGATYGYGDTLVIAFAVNRCARSGGIIVNDGTWDTVMNMDCSYTETREYWPEEGVDSADAAGRVCRFYRTAEQLGIGFDIGFYKLPLVDNNSIHGTWYKVNFGGGITPANNVNIKIFDTYIDDNLGGGPLSCNPDEATAWRIISAIKAGKIGSGYFSVAPRQD